MQSLEDAEELVCILHVETNPIVPNDESVLSDDGLAFDIDLGKVTVARVFNSIAEQVDENLTKQGRVPVRVRESSNGEPNLSGRRCSDKVPDHVLRQGRHVYPAGFQCLASDTGELEKIVNQNSHLSSTLRNHVEHSRSLIVESI